MSHQINITNKNKPGKAQGFNLSYDIIIFFKKNLNTV